MGFYFGRFEMIDYLEDLDLGGIASDVAKLAIKKANKDLQKYCDYIEKNKSMKFKIGQVVRKVKSSIMDNLMGDTYEYYVVSPYEYNVDWNDDANYYLTRMDENTLLGEQESNIEAVDTSWDELPDSVKSISFYIGGVERVFKTFC